MHNQNFDKHASTELWKAEQEQEQKKSKKQSAT
jgi:hypothetical protein